VKKLTAKHLFQFILLQWQLNNSKKGNFKEFPFFMKTLIILFASLTLLASCGRKDAIFVSDKPAVAAKEGKPAEAVVNPRPAANRPASKTFFLDGLL
jgi:hypothetical protein